MGSKGRFVLVIVFSVLGEHPNVDLLCVVGSYSSSYYSFK
jgi:hypothetical protein